jgi:hypothetical protein
MKPSSQKGRSIAKPTWKIRSIHLRQALNMTQKPHPHRADFVPMGCVGFGLKLHPIVTLPEARGCSNTRRRDRQAVIIERDRRSRHAPELRIDPLVDPHAQARRSGHRSLLSLIRV